MMRQWTWNKLTVFLLLLFVAKSSAILPAQAIRVSVNGQVSESDPPIRRQLWEGQHITTLGSNLYKRIEVELQKHIPIKQIRSIDSELTMDQISTAPGQYDYSIIDRFIANIDTLTTDPKGVSLFFTLSYLPRWLAETPSQSCAPADRNPIFSKPKDYEQWATVVRDVVSYVRDKTPDRVRYYEIWNEPESYFWQCQTDRRTAITEYARFYRETANAIKVGDDAADREGKVGGPAMGLEKEVADSLTLFPLFDKFLEQIDGAPLDFVSWGRYFEYLSDQSSPPAPPSIDVSDAIEVRRLLVLWGRDPKTVELINSEWTRPSYEDGPVTKDSEARMAAILPARYSSMLEAGINRSFFFAIGGGPEQFITRWPQTPEEKVRPSYNALRMMNTLTGTQAGVTGGSLDSRGEGVSALASVDGKTGTFNIVLWNFREHLMSSPVTIDLTARYPDFLAGQPLRLRRYLVSPENSNWKHDAARDHLERVEDRTVDGSRDYVETFPNVSGNSIMLLTFCLEGPACAELASPPFPIGPQIRNLFVDLATHTTADVSWDTPAVSASPRFLNYVQYRRLEDDAWTSTPMVEDTSTRHLITITDLSPDQTYALRSVTADLTEAGNPETISEEWLTFKTAANANETIHAFSPSDDTFVTFINPPSECKGIFNYQYLLLGLHVTEHQVFLKFNVTGIVGAVRSTDLRLFTVTSGSYGGSAHRIEDTAWVESQVDCVSFPAMDEQALFDLNTFVNSGVSYDFRNLAVSGNGPVSFGLKQPQPFALTGYASKENGTANPRGFYPPPILYVTATNP